MKDEVLESQAVVIEEPGPPDPRETLATWANEQDEWVRSIVRHVLGTGRALSSDDIDVVYALFRQEKGLDSERFQRSLASRWGCWRRMPNFRLPSSGSLT